MTLFIVEPHATLYSTSDKALWHCTLSNHKGTCCTLIRVFMNTLSQQGKPVDSPLAQWPLGTAPVSNPPLDPLMCVLCTYCHGRFDVTIGRKCRPRCQTCMVDIRCASPTRSSSSKTASCSEGYSSILWPVRASIFWKSSTSYCVTMVSERPDLHASWDAWDTVCQGK